MSASDHCNSSSASVPRPILARCHQSNVCHRPSFSSSQDDDSSTESSSFSEDHIEEVSRGRPYPVGASPSPRLQRSSLKGVASDLDKFMCDSDDGEEDMDFGKGQTLRQETLWQRPQHPDIRQVKVMLGTNAAIEDEDDDALIPKPLSYGRGEADDMHGRTPLASPKGAGLGIAPALASPRQGAYTPAPACSRVSSYSGDERSGRASLLRRTSATPDLREDRSMIGSSTPLDLSRPRSYTLSVGAPPAPSTSSALHYARRPSATCRPADIPLFRPPHARLSSISHSPFLTPPLSPRVGREMPGKESSNGCTGTPSTRCSFSTPPKSPKMKRRSTVTGKSSLASEDEPLGYQSLSRPSLPRDSSRKWSGRPLRSDTQVSWQATAQPPTSPTLSTHQRRTRHQRSQASISSTVSSTSTHSQLLPWLAYYPTGSFERGADTESSCSNGRSSEEHPSVWATGRNNRSRSEADLLPAVTTKVCAVAKVQVQPPAKPSAAERRSSQCSNSSNGSEKWTTTDPVSPLGWLRPPPSLGRGRSHSDTRGMMESVEQVLRAL